MAMVVHGAQTVERLGAIPAEGTCSTVGRVDAIYDMKKFAQLVLSTETTIGGAKAFSTSWSIIFRNAGGFGGPRPPESDAPPVPKDRPADWEVREATTPEQALLYRLSGDHNPLHADPAFAEKVGFPQGPILHGLCTFGFVCRAVVRSACGGDPRRLARLSAQFRRPVWPGDTLVTRGFAVDGDRVALDTRVEARDEAVLAGAWARIERAQS
jgi:acyl dehydratase